jgi:hypothetical protein
MLLPNNAKARWATVSPTARAMAEVTTDCISGLPLETALEFCRRLIRSSRSRGIRIRSSRINVSEKASRICFAVIWHTPPIVWLNRFSSSGANGEAAFAKNTTTKRVDYQTER